MQHFTGTSARRLARRIFAASIVVSSIATATLRPLSAQTMTTLIGVVASQPNAPGKLTGCNALITGDSYSPQLSFDPDADVKSSTVTYSFFDKNNMSLGQVQLTPPYAAMPLPKGTDNFTCAIVSEQLAGGAVFPGAAAAGANTGLVIGGVAGVGLIAALAFHSSSSTASTPSRTPTPFVTPTPVATVSPTASPSPSVSPSSSASASASPSSSASASASPSASASASASPSASASASASPSASASASASPSASASASVSPSASASASASPSASASASASPSASASASASPSASASASASPSASASASASPSASASASASPSASASASASPSTSPSASASPSTSPSASASPSTSPSASASPSTSPSASASPSTSPSASASPSASPSVNPSAPVLSPSSISLNGAGTTGTTQISESAYSGTFSSQASTCGSGGTPLPGQTSGPIATISSGPYADPSTITVTADQAGKCTVVFADSMGRTVTLSVDVTTTAVVIDKRGGKTTPLIPTPRAGSAPTMHSGRL